MTDRLSALLADLVTDTPPSARSLTDMIDKGRRIRRRRRRMAVAAVGVTAAAGMAVLTTVVGMGLGISGDPHSPATAGASSAPAGPSPTVTVVATAPSGEAGATTRSPGPPPGSGAASIPAGPRERLGDPGFEATPPGWAVFGPSTVLTAVPAGRSGRQALKITSTGQPPVIAGATNNPVRVITSAGTVYQAICWVRSDSVIKAFIQVQEYSQTWRRAGDPQPSTHVELVDPARWYKLSVTYTAAHDGNLLPLSVLSDDLHAAGPSLVVDDCSLTSP
ncbi:hypothetical protein KZZ52_17110 [Dactylosporangium sp. AC04546]|uniref:hypothetical protein n=1 Tax=Dactylosporangium sp. AC04546 TaxID=2862460 RepID=UPI001EDFF9CA|nr:hypothetical protein [Dactylosporangium sp. AC04546]WVK87019.1 hypothetical protein KZZ52_17110 [Dactylosporangium sp. AC04546]